MLYSSYFSSLLLCCSLTSASPVASNAVKPLSRRAVAPSNTQIWIDDGNGNLSPGDFSAVKFPDGLPSPGDTVFRADQCNDDMKERKDNLANWRLYWCNIRTQVVYGAPIKISEDVDCSGTQTCGITQTDAIAVSEAFQINGGTDFAGDIAGLIKATAKVSRQIAVNESELSY